MCHRKRLAVTTTIASRYHIPIWHNHAYKICVDVVCRLAGMPTKCVCRRSVDFLRLCSVKQRGPTMDGRTKRTWTMDGDNVSPPRFASGRRIVSGSCQHFNVLCKALVKSHCKDLSIRRHSSQPTVYAMHILYCAKLIKPTFNFLEDTRKEIGYFIKESLCLFRVKVNI